ncbi:MAG: hypothetical protein M3Q71_13235 [Chloroflexota bacterium]|nr:hypothetical protein [Chloroflexota bacterium]
MVPGFTERECLAAEARRRELLDRAARERSLHAQPRTRARRASAATGGSRATTFMIWVRSLKLAPTAPSGH